jgi:3D (Asp-Asp-Asp) domain-containing protein
MRARLASIIGVLLVVSGAYAAEPQTLVRVTTYWREEGQLRAAWNGARLRNGHCAVDPKKIRYGSRILLGDEELTAVDTGPAVVSRKAARLSGRNAAERSAPVIDRYFETKSQAVAWGKSHPHFMNARILSPQEVIAKESDDRHKNLSSKAIVATQQVPRQLVIKSPNVQSADLYSVPLALYYISPIGSAYLRVSTGPSSAISPYARRRSGGELVAGKLVGKDLGRPLGRSRLQKMT